MRILLLAFLVLTYTAYSQEKPKHQEHNHGDHEHHDHQEPKKPVHEEHTEMTDTMRQEPDHDIEMRSSFSLHLPMNRDGSGTSWQPDVTPMFMHMAMKGNTNYMLHGFLFLRYNAQDITKVTQGRGGAKLDAPNMFMFMLSHKLSEKDMVSVLTMFSLDPITVGGSGYPLLFQTGETYKGVPLVDRQHPHDLFSELAVNYTHSFSRDIDVNAYLGYPGEPALGPVVFMHRLSGMNNANAPLGHHWQDATHITFGVGTLGFRYKNVKLEGSIFTGREPDENRYNFDRPRFDSYSARLSVNPHKTLALQVSRGFLKSPEVLEPDENITRTTASVTHTHLIDGEKYVSTSAVWGLNASHHDNLHSILLESNLQLKPLAIYGRFEYLQKNAHELNIPEVNGGRPFAINALTLGVNKTIFRHHLAFTSVGVQGTMNFADERLRPLYGKMPLGAQVYLRVSPPQAHVHEL